MAIPIYSEFSNNPKSYTTGSGIHQHQPEDCVNKNQREVRRTSYSGMTVSVSVPVRTSGSSSEQVPFLQQMQHQQLSLYYNVLTNSLPTRRIQESTGPRYRPFTSTQGLGESTLRLKRLTLPDIVNCHQTGSAVSNSQQFGKLPEMNYGLQEKHAVLKEIIFLDVEVELACQRIGWDLRLIADNLFSMSGRKSVRISTDTVQPTLRIPVGLQIVVSSVFIYIGYAYMLKSA